MITIEIRFDLTRFRKAVLRRTDTEPLCHAILACNLHVMVRHCVGCVAGLHVIVARQSCFVSVRNDTFPHDATGCSNRCHEPIKCRAEWKGVSDWFAETVARKPFAPRDARLSDSYKSDHYCLSRSVNTRTNVKFVLEQTLHSS